MKRDISDVKIRVYALLRKAGFKRTSVFEHNAGFEPQLKCYYYYGGLHVYLDEDTYFFFGWDNICKCSAHICEHGNDYATWAEDAERVLTNKINHLKTL